MKTFMKKFSMLSVLALSLFAVGCDALQEPIEPRLNPNGMTVTSIAGLTYTVAVENDPDAQSVGAWIGAAGGKLVLGNHEIQVSQGAVTLPAYFRIERNSEQPLRVELTASRLLRNDVGAAGFNAPVTLRLSFANATQLPADPSQLKIVYFRPDGLVEELASQVDVTGQKVSTAVPHFSLFGIAWP